MAQITGSTPLAPADVGVEGGVQWNQAMPYAREICKFERTHTKFGPPGLPPYVYQPYPAMLYRPSRDAQGRVRFEGHVVHDEHEQRNMESRGYVAGGQGEALAALERQEQATAVAAAERADAERRMSPNAQAETRAVDEATDQHVPVIPEAPIRRGPGRPTNEEIAARRAREAGNG